MGNCDFKSEQEKVGSGISKLNFQRQYPIGRGGYGKVWKVKSKTDEKHYAKKEMSKALIIAKKSVTSVMFERDLLTRLRSDFVINICYAFQDQEKLYMLMDLCSGGDLRYHLYKNKKFNEKETSMFFNFFYFFILIFTQNLLYAV